MVKKILVTGATGFTGRRVVPLLVERGYEVTCFVRPSSERSAVALPGVSFAVGDIDEADSLVAALRSKDALINIAYLANGGESRARRAEGIIGACFKAGVRRAVFISSTSVFTKLRAPAKEAKLNAEKAVIDSGLDYTILRPTMIYGAADDRNMTRLIRYLRRSPVVFVPGDGEFRQQPIHVDDLARAIVDCVGAGVTFGKAYNVSGAHSVTFNEVIEQTCEALGVRRVKLHVPLSPALWLARLSRKWFRKPLIKEEQLLRLNEDKCFDHADARRDFGFAPRPFAEGIRQEVRRL